MSATARLRTAAVLLAVPLALAACSDGEAETNPPPADGTVEQGDQGEPVVPSPDGGGLGVPTDIATPEG